MISDGFKDSRFRSMLEGCGCDECREAREELSGLYFGHWVGLDMTHPKPENDQEIT